VADGEGIEVPDAALALVARAARGAYRDAVSTLDQLAAATEEKITVQDVLQLLGAVEEEALFRLCDLVVDRDTAGALTFIEELSEQGQDLGRLVTDLLEHLRHLLLVQHMGEVPETLPVTGESAERLRDQANQLGTSTVVRLIDLLTPAVEDMRQGGDPRLPLELALVKVTRPGSDLSREGLAFRIQRLEDGHPEASERLVGAPRPDVAEPPKREASSVPPDVGLVQLLHRALGGSGAGHDEHGRAAGRGVRPQIGERPGDIAPVGLDRGQVQPQHRLVRGGQLGQRPPRMPGVPCMRCHIGKFAVGRRAEVDRRRAAAGRGHPGRLEELLPGAHQIVRPGTHLLRVGDQHVRLVG